MKKYEIQFSELCTYKVEIKAESLEKAEEIVNSGNFSDEEIIDRDDFQIEQSFEIEGDKK